MKRPITRRGLLAVAATLPVVAQQPAIPSTPGEEAAATQAQVKSNAEQLGKVKLPMSTEPAAHFKA